MIGMSARHTTPPVIPASSAAAGPQVGNDHRHEPGRERGVEPPDLRVDRGAQQRTDDGADVPEHEDRDAGDPEGIPTALDRRLRERHGGRLVDHQLGGEQARDNDPVSTRDIDSP